jgi:hypothetical protein
MSDEQFTHSISPEGRVFLFLFGPFYLRFIY